MDARRRYAREYLIVEGESSTHPRLMEGARARATEPRTDLSVLKRQGDIDRSSIIILEILSSRSPP